MNLRLEGVDTPKSWTNICREFREIDLAYAATDRLHDLLNTNSWTVEIFGRDNTGARRLATIKMNGEDVCHILIREGLARHWPDDDEIWC